MKKVILALTLAISVTCVKAQVGIGTDDPKATLDVTAVNKSGVITTVEGVLIPRVDRERVQSMTNVEKSTMIYVNEVTTGSLTGTAINIDTEGFYYFNGSVWVELGSDSGKSTMPKFFYMPSIVVDTSNPDPSTAFTRNLFAEYKAQFTGQLYNYKTDTFSTNPDFIKSVGAPAIIPILPNATDLYYYITDYDKTALSDLFIDENGVLSYKIIGTGTDYSFVNIVFVVK